MSNKVDNNPRKEEPNMFTLFLFVAFTAAVIFGVVLLALYVYGVH